MSYSHAVRQWTLVLQLEGEQEPKAIPMASKIPPHVARELRRHVGRGHKQSAPSGPSGEVPESESFLRNPKVLAGCLALTGGMMSIPYFFVNWIQPLGERDGALTGSQIRRGAFNNSGSKDAGKGELGCAKCICVDVSYPCAATKIHTGTSSVEGGSNSVMRVSRTTGVTLNYLGGTIPATLNTANNLRAKRGGECNDAISLW